MDAAHEIQRYTYQDTNIDDPARVRSLAKSMGIDVEEKLPDETLLDVLDKVYNSPHGAAILRADIEQMRERYKDQLDKNMYEDGFVRRANSGGQIDPIKVQHSNSGYLDFLPANRLSTPGFGGYHVSIPPLPDDSPIGSIVVVRRTPDDHESTYAIEAGYPTRGKPDIILEFNDWLDEK